MSTDTYQSIRDARRDSWNELRQRLGLPPRTGNEVDNVARTFNALRALKQEYTRRSAVTSSYSEGIAASCTADQIDALLNALDALDGTVAWSGIRKAFKGFGDE